MLLINCSNREKNCFKILNDIKTEKDKLISLSNKEMKFCLGCESCCKTLNKYCVLNDYITNVMYDEILNAKDIIIASPIYMSNVNAILKNLLDRMNPLYHHDLLNGKNIYLVMTGGTSKEDNEEEINSIINYFIGISDWLNFNFEFLEYFTVYNDLEDDKEYASKIKAIKERLCTKL